jgi:hypothetical protein
MDAFQGKEGSENKKPPFMRTDFNQVAGLGFEPRTSGFPGNQVRVARAG